MFIDWNCWYGNVGKFMGWLNFMSMWSYFGVGIVIVRVAVTQDVEQSKQFWLGTCAKYPGGHVE